MRNAASHIERQPDDADATVAGGSGGGTAVNNAGQLVGVPTLATPIDCRPGDTNRDGVVDESDVGCVPVGDSFLRLRPINLAKPLLEQTSPFFASPMLVTPTTGTSAATPTATRTLRVNPFTVATLAATSKPTTPPTVTRTPRANLTSTTNVTYASPSYGYTLDYDPSIWDKLQETSRPSAGGSLDVLEIGSTSSLLSLVGETGAEGFDAVDLCEARLG